MKSLQCAHGLNVKLDRSGLPNDVFPANDCIHSKSAILHVAVLSTGFNVVLPTFQPDIHSIQSPERSLINVKVPPAPPGKPSLAPGTPQNQPDLVTIRWEPPINDGGAPVTGYLVEHKRTGSPHWVRSTPKLVTKPELTLSGLEPGWRYQFRVSAENSAGMSEPGELSEPLTVTLYRSGVSVPHFMLELKDTTALENEKVEFLVAFRGHPTPKVSWYKDGFEIFSNRRMRVVTEEEQSSLVIFQASFTDEGEIKCTATNRAGHSVTKAKLKLEAPPSIRLPRQYEEGLLFEKDEVIRLKVSVAGRPLPRVTWFHNGEQVTFGGRYEVNNTDKTSSLRVMEARRADRGEYQVKATNRLGEDVASFLVTITDRPLPPGKAKVLMTLGKSVTLSWTEPDDDGGCKIGNYLVEYYRLGWNVWLKAATCRQMTTTLGDLIEGSEYKFRIKAESPYGVSDPSEESDVIFVPDPKRGLMEASTISRSMTMGDMQSHNVDNKHPEFTRRGNIGKEEKTKSQSTGKLQSDKDSGEPKNRALQVSSNKDSPSIKIEKESDPIIPVTVIQFQEMRQVHKAIGRGTVPNKPTDATVEIVNKENADMKRRKVKESTGTTTTRSPSTPAQPQKVFKSQSTTDTVQSPKREPAAVVKEVQSLRTNIKRNSQGSVPVPKVLCDKKPEGNQVSIDREELRKRISPSRTDQSLVRSSTLPREDDDSIIHGSSELMLVLLPERRESQADRGSDRGSEQRILFDENEISIPPPMSLSSPELGSGDIIVTPPLRNAVSSTELLHEKAMARFYQAVAQEEAEKARLRRQSIERRSSPLRPTRIRINSLEVGSGDGLNILKTPFMDPLPRERLQTQQKKQVEIVPRENSRYEDLNEETYHPRNMTAMSNRSESSEILHPDKFPTIKVLRKDKLGEYKLPPKDFVPKPILKKAPPVELSPSLNQRVESVGKKTTWDIVRADNKEQPIQEKGFTSVSKSPSPSKSEIDAVVRRPKKDEVPQTSGGVAEDFDSDVSLSAAETARNRRLRIRQKSLEEDSEANLAIVSHYGDIIREYGQVKKAPAVLYLNTEELKAAAFYEDEHATVIRPLDVTPPPKIKISDKVNTFFYDGGESHSGGRLNNSDHPKKVFGPQPKRQIPDVPPPTEVVRSPPARHETAYLQSPAPTTLAHVSVSLRNNTPLRPEEERQIVEARKKVRSFMGFLTDLALFSVACWLYVFKDERLAIPVLAFMVYRQVFEAIKKRLPRRWFQRRQEPALWDFEISEYANKRLKTKAWDRWREERGSRKTRISAQYNKKILKITSDLRNAVQLIRQ
uniref:Titin n=2 Tax=Timema TaxID=61471 RepID=A0A7R8Z8Y8_TIMDO|nr:unnamed protein product [Timema douglasi]